MFTILYERKENETVSFHRKVKKNRKRQICKYVHKKGGGLCWCHCSYELFKVLFVCFSEYM